MALVEVKVPDIGDFEEVAVIELLVKPGDTVKPERLPGIMAADRPDDWGASRHRYWYTGHIHSKNAIEFPGVQWESFRTLAPADSYAASHGYRSGRDMVLIVHHRDFGEVERHRCDVGMVTPAK